MKRALAIAAIAAAMIPPPPVASAPKAANQHECQAFWDVALVARANAVAGIERAKTLEAFKHIYNTGGDARAEAIVVAIVDAALRETRSANVFADRLRDACVSRMGDMNSVLGVSS